MSNQNPSSPVRFVIVTAGRTGSTRLRLLLDSHPQISCHGELFGENLSTLAEPDSPAMMQILHERTVAPVQFLHTRAFAPFVNSKSVGFKILYSQFLERWPGIDKSLIDDRLIRIIHLRRRNGLKRFLSEYFVGTVTHTHAVRIGEPKPQAGPVIIPVASVLDNIVAYDHQVAQVRRMFESHPYFEIDYEDSLDDNGPAIERLQRFLGVPHANLSCNLVKILPDDPQTLIANFAELAMALAGSPYEWMIGGAS